MTHIKYGQHPELISHRDLGLVWQEFMHYLYLPVRMPETRGIFLPPNLQFVHDIVADIDRKENPGNDKYIYVTARRGFAAPGNPLNRPGWHADGFGTEDINYIWSDKYPTRIAVGEFPEISEDHIESASQFDKICENPDSFPGIKIYDLPENVLARLDPTVVHSVPIIPAPGGERSFLKVSVSDRKFNLMGNSHNHLINYTWPMYSRETVRNDPAWAGGDSYEAKS